MFDFFENIYPLVLGNDVFHVYLLLFLLMFLNALIMFPPSEYICIVAGILVFNKLGSLWPVILIATCANLIGTSFWYGFGRCHIKVSRDIVNFAPSGTGFRRLWIKVRSVYVSGLKNIEKSYRKHGVWYVLLLRNVPIVRSIASYPAGRIHMPVQSFLFFSLVGILIRVSLWTFWGYSMGVIALHYKWPIAISVGLACLLMFNFAIKFIAKE